jgi:hypothetical protein
LVRAERVVTILRVLAPCPPSVKGHFRDLIADIMGRIGVQPLEQSTADAIVAELS